MKREAIDHTKMKRLCRRLDIPLWQGVGLLESIWHLTARETPRGDIGKLSDEDIALAIEYRGDESKMIEALVSSGWIDRDPVERLIIHDWHEHANDTVHNRLARARQHFVGGHAPKLTRLPSKERDAATEFFGSCVQNIDSCVLQAHDTHTASARQAHDVHTANVPPLPLPLPLPLPEPLPEPEALRTGAPRAEVRPIRSEERSITPGEISPATWDDFRNRYETSGKPLNESDFAKAAMEAATLNLSEANMTERVIPCLAAELPGWAERDIGMIPFPASWLKSQPWTRKAKPRDPREPALTREQQRQAEIDASWGGAHATR